jgi:hypothetical protein
MPVSRIEKRDVSGAVIQWAEPAKDGKYRCFTDGLNKRPVLLGTLDEVADFLKLHPNSGVRMNPGGSKISARIYIDGVPR